MTEKKIATSCGGGIRKNQSIVYLRLLACIIITNSHMRNIYPESLSILSFGGHIGNTLFFFASGWCLTNCTKRSFVEYSWRRFLRIYIPYLLIMPFLLFVPTDDFGLKGGPIWRILFPTWPYHFIVSMIILSVLYYFSTVLNKKVSYLAQSILVMLALVAYTFCIYNGSYKYNDNFSIPMLLCFYVVMLLGGYSKENNNPKHFLLYAIIATLSFATYIIQSKLNLQGNMQLIQLLISIAFAFFAGNSILSLNARFKENKYVTFLANLTLEIYLVQEIILLAFKNVCFPINFVFAVISIIACGYSLNFCSQKVMGYFTNKIQFRLKNNSSN